VGIGNYRHHWNNHLSNFQMTKGLQILEKAIQELGTNEVPMNSNKTKYGKWFGYDGVPWCGIFVSFCYHMAGVPLGNIGFKLGFAGCQTAFAYFTKTKEITKNPQPGDIVLFDWNGDKRYDHTGLFVKKIDDQHFETIEGNTSVSNDSNGGIVMKRVRKYSQAIFVHPKVLN
jgi:hypothetical protein